MKERDLAVDLAAHDAAWWNLLDSLIDENALRYESQSRELIQYKNISYNFRNSRFTFELTPFGCSHTSQPHSSEVATSLGWSRLGWSKAGKLAKLPNLIAYTETSALLKWNSTY